MRRTVNTQTVSNFFFSSGYSFFPRNGAVIKLIHNQHGKEEGGVPYRDKWVGEGEAEVRAACSAHMRRGCYVAAPAKGVSINDVHKNFGFFGPLPLVRISN